VAEDSDVLRPSLPVREHDKDSHYESPARHRLRAAKNGTVREEPQRYLLLSMLLLDKWNGKSPRVPAGNHLKTTGNR